MGRWTVVDGDQTVVIESAADRISLEITPGPQFETDAEGIRDLRRKLGMAIGDAQACSS